MGKFLLLSFAIATAFTATATQSNSIAAQEIANTANVKQNAAAGGNAAINSVKIPSIVNANTPFALNYTIQNNGNEPITSLEAEITVNGTLVDTWALDVSDNPIQPRKNKKYKKDFTIAEAMENAKVGMTITMVNGGENTNPNDKTKTRYDETRVLPEGVGFKRNVVAEELTATWCGWCPAAVAVFEGARKKITDGSLILIAVHSNDAMGENDYNNGLKRYITGLPGIYINRENKGTVNKEYASDLSALETAYEKSRLIPAFAGISLNVTFTDDKKETIDCFSTSQFVESALQNQYRISYVLVEDNVGPYNQSNNYSGDTFYKVDGWEEKGPSVSWIYNDVARKVIEFDGIVGSLPETLEEGVKYEHKQTIELKNYKPENCRVVAMLINTATGVIENACEARIDMPGAVDSILGNSDNITISGTTGAIAIEGAYSNATVYNLDGTIATVATGENTIETPAGLYIVKVDNTIAKVIVR